MNRIKTIKNSNYTTIDNSVTKDIKLSLKAKGLLLVIMSLPNDWDFSINGISMICKEGRDSIYSAINELIENRYCQRVIIKNDKGKIMGSDYTFFESPYTDNPYTDNPDMGNPTQLNTNIIKDLNNKNLKVIVPKKELDLTTIIKDDNWLGLVKHWLKYKKERRETYKSLMSINTMYKKLIKNSNNDFDTAKKIIESAIANNYSGFFSIETKKQKQTIQQVQEVPSHLKKVLNFE
jgi:hypothetical protein